MPHEHFIPHLILNDIIAVPEGDGGLDVKIDYKLSRFIDPRFDRPAPMLKQLLSVHPDIVNQRPLDFRSDIWSLGKIFVELLSGDLDIDDLENRVDGLDLPEEMAVLLRVMLAEDPDLRPQSMEEVAASLERITQKTDRPETVPPPRLFRKLQRRIRALAAVVAVLVVAAVGAWFYLERTPPDTEQTLEGYANLYARSVGFILVDYWLEAEGNTVFRNVAEGTAFLVDREGYLLTSRHVVCPWLEDPRFDAAVSYLRSRDMTPELKYRIYLWFEGARAFNPSGRLIAGADLGDFYLTENAYTTDASPKVEISGVARPPMRIRQLAASPLKDDFAVIKIERVPEGLKPLPLNLEMDPRRLPKLTRVIALGFPLGSRTQVDTVNASVVRGNVRRAFENMFQIDASLHGGNSGGPVIDTNGKVIGIVSAVAMDFTQGIVPMMTPVWDIGLILPITEAVQLLVDLKAGQAKWNGVLDFSIEATLGKIRESAGRARWAEAQALADEKLVRNLQPELVTAAGMMRFCGEDFNGARRRFSQALSLDPEDSQARWMLVLIDWLTGSQDATALRQELAGADWKSPAEFQRYLLDILEGRVSPAAAADGWYTPAEKAWVRTVVGLLEQRRGKIEEAETLFEEAILSAEPDVWERFLARARLERVRKQRRLDHTSPGRRAEHESRVEAFERSAAEDLERRRSRTAKLAAVWEGLRSGELSFEDKRGALRQVLEHEPENRALAGTLAFAEAAAGELDASFEQVRGVLATGSRENALRLSLSLLEAGILHHQGKNTAASERLAELARRAREPWFVTVAEYLRGQQTEEALRREAGEVPEQIMTGFAAAGFWAEGAKDKKAAARFYRDALASLLDNWLEYDFVRERIQRLKRTEE